MSYKEDLLIEPIRESFATKVLEKRLSSHIADIKYLGGGSFSAFYLKSGNKEFVAKFPKFFKTPNEALKKMHHEKMLSEIIKPSVAPHEIVSQIKILNPQNDGFDFPISIYLHLNGDKVKEMHLFDKRRDKNKTEQLARLLGDFLTKFHNIKLNNIKDVPLSKKHTEESIKKSYLNNYEKYKKDIFPILSDEEKRWVNDLHTNFFKIVDKIKIHPTLCHGDFDDSNTLVSKSFDRLQIIDLEEACIDDPIIDFCTWVNNGEDFVKKILKYYRRNIDEYFWDRILFYNKRLPLVYFIMGVEQNNKKFIDYGRKYLKQKMKKK